MEEVSGAKPGYPYIMVVSSRTLDSLPPAVGQAARVAPGGPAFYIASALERLGCACDVLAGPTVRVRVVSGSEGEEYVIPSLERIALPDRLRADAVILSPIMNEIDPDHLPQVEGLLAVDVQGFVREPGRPSGTRTSPVRLAPLLRKARVVKVSRKELALLDPPTVAALDDCITVETRGRSGAIVRAHGREFAVESRPVEVRNTIGAGDMFLSAFVCALLRGGSVKDAGHTAARFTEVMLAERVRQEPE